MTEAWLAIDVVLPEQWGVAFGSFDPYRLLRIALLASAVKDMALPHPRGNQCLGCDVVRWMHGDTSSKSLSFEEVCAALGLSSEAVRRAVRARLVSHLNPTFTIDLPTLDFDANASRAIPA